MDFQVTTAFNKIAALATRRKIAVIQGSAGASKSYSIAQYCFLYALKHDGSIITILNDSYPNLRDGNMTDMRHIFESANMSFANHYNIQKAELKFRNDSLIRFRYASDNKPDLGKGRRRDVLFIDEANRFGYMSAFNFIQRTSKKVFLAFNPDRPSWINKELPQLKDEFNNKLSGKIVLTYKDNELLSPQEREFIESRRSNVKWFRVYGLGLPGFYSECQIYAYDTIPSFPEEKTLQKLIYGLDFGVSPGATALVKVGIKDPNIYVQLIFNKYNLLMEGVPGSDKHCVADELALHGVPKRTLIIADSASKRAIQDIRKYGYNIVGVKKTSVIDGIDKVKAYNINVTADSKELIDTMDTFFYKKDSNGKPLQEIDGHEPDPLVAMRYAIMGKDMKRVFTKEELNKYNKLLPI